MHILNARKQHTPGHINCPVCAGAMHMPENEVGAELSFAEAFDQFARLKEIDLGGVASNARYLAPRSIRDLRQYGESAKKFFGRIPMDKIHAGHFREYQRARAVCDKTCGDWVQPAGANLIIKEVNTVIRVMKAAGVWNETIKAKRDPLQLVESDVQRAMTPNEMQAWLRAAASRPEWQIIYWYSILALRTTASTNELRALRLGDIFLDQGYLNIRNEGAKGKQRIRTIPINSPELSWSLSMLIERAARLGSGAPHHYLFPLRIGGPKFDPAQPMTVWGLRKPWDAVKAAAGIDWVRLYDLRHTAITRLAENGTPIHVILSLAGHVSMRMQQHYTTISMQAKRQYTAMPLAGLDSQDSVPAAARPSPDCAPRALAAPVRRPAAAGEVLAPARRAVAVAPAATRQTMIGRQGGRRATLRRAIPEWRLRRA
jgi:integrase